MPLETFFANIRAGQRVAFSETMTIIETYFDYRPTRFYNGIGQDRLDNAAGSNEGSCKIFSLAQQYALSETETLALFGDYYWQDVLENPEGSDHANIRTFMRCGWPGISWDSETALSLRQSPGCAPRP